ncbi:DUF7547 family protein [Halorhabdus tiamatea]|nr:hypothetical protein [Halorhabdus tiamatea]CCQ34086.1 hypothetical protein HTIA_1969 [Halorhabdus tiamatea SARL4B]
MSSQPDRSDLPEVLRELTSSLVRLRRDLRSDQRSGGRGLDRLLRLTTDVTIPATILVLETNIRALRLLQRTLRIVDGSETAEESRTTAGEDVASVGRSVVDRLDDALADVQTAVEGDVDSRTRDHLEDARDLNRKLEARLDELSEGAAAPGGEEESTSDDRGAAVDVEAELRSIKDQHGDSGGGGDSDEGDAAGGNDSDEGGADGRNDSDEGGAADGTDQGEGDGSDE